METQSYRRNNINRSVPDISHTESESGFEPQVMRRKGWVTGLAAIPRWISSKKKHKVASLLLLAIIAGGAYGAYEKFFNLSNEERAQKELAAAVVAISKHMILPEGDEPVLATVTDAETLKAQQPFFAGAVNGDQLLLFPRSVKAVIYSPSRNRIVNVGPIQQGQVATASASKTAQTAPVQPAAGVVSVEVRNGSGQDGLGSSLAQQISQDSRFSIARVGDAKSNDYTATVVVDVSKKSSNRESLNVLTSALVANVISELPKGEAPSNADAVVIIGSGAGR